MTPSDLKNYRAPRDPWPWIIGSALVVAFICVAGPVHYARDLDLEAEVRVMRAELASKQSKPRSQTAPLGIRCGTRQYIAYQSDGGAWLARCIDVELNKRRVE